MGRLFAEELASGDIALDLNQQLAIHFSSNCYPPVPHSMIEPAEEAISMMNQGFFNEEISLPDGVSYQGRDFARAYAIVENFRLDAWIDQDVIQID